MNYFRMWNCMADLARENPHLAMGLFLLRTDSQIARILADTQGLAWFNKDTHVTLHRAPIPISVMRQYARMIAQYKEGYEEGLDEAENFLVCYESTAAFNIPTFRFCKPEMAIRCGEKLDDFLALPDEHWLGLKTGQVVLYRGTEFVVIQTDEDPGAVFLAPRECVDPNS